VAESTSLGANVSAMARRYGLRSTAMSATVRSPIPGVAARSCSPSARHTCEGAFTKSPKAARRRSPMRRLRALPHSIASKRSSGATAPMRVAPFGRPEPSLSSARAWLVRQLDLVSGKSNMAEAIRYGLRQWEGLTRFPDDGRIEIDSNDYVSA
jgi:hypothetical protein